MSKYTLAEVCDHCSRDLGHHLIPDSRCPGLTTYFFMAAYHQSYEEHCLCGHLESAHGVLRCYFEAECGCRDFERDNGRDH